MEVLLNELSLHGQFSSIQDFKSAMATIMLTRNILKQSGRNLHCHKNFLQVQITAKINLQEALSEIGRIDKNMQRSVLSWLTKDGPFWDEDRQHNSGEYFEYKAKVVTDSSLGEAAYRCFIGSECHTLSFSSLNWQLSPIKITWHRNESCTIDVDVPNHWEFNSLKVALEKASGPITSWKQLADNMKRRCQNLNFSTNSFVYLYPHPFADSAAKRIVELLLFLDKFKTCFDENGKRTDEGNRLYQNHFTGDKAWFTDSSSDEINNFSDKLTFNHPSKSDECLFCSWHGKIKTPQFRIHFSWPISANKPLYVPYIGQKLTKK
ncbi:MAG: hypothetical protein K2Q11_07930 [Burkholderiaceae bacterium]|nr:hypothetical protein [Burkholderiaceae bacterium]